MIDMLAHKDIENIIKNVNSLSEVVYTLCDRINRIERLYSNKKVSKRVDKPQIPDGWIQLAKFSQKYSYINKSDLSRLGRMWPPALPHYQKCSKSKIVEEKALHQLFGTQEFAKICPKVFRKREKWINFQDDRPIVTLERS